MKTAGMAIMALAFATCFSANAQEGAAEAETLYNKQCATCHGLMPGPSSRLPRPGMLAAASGLDAGSPTMRDAGVLAVAPLYGPPLQGVVGREAGTFQGYTYSKAFLQKMAGKKWDEGSIDLWITSSQKFVPGSFMFYSQNDAGIRSKIIAYLKTR